MDTTSSITTSARIRQLAAEGMAIANIARELGIRYQHAYNVLKGSRSDLAPAAPMKTDPPPLPTLRLRKPNPKPPLPVETLTEGGFSLATRWTLSEANDLVLEMPVTKEVGVYAFVKDGFAVYVGVATMGLSKRLYYYGKPGVSQRTSLRLNTTLKEELLAAGGIDIYVAVPLDLTWNGLPVHGAAGLELGLIKKYALPWNMRSAG